ncbi:hypothetical protein V8E53_007965, partial [Lactarius tabidus]
SRRQRKWPEYQIFCRQLYHSCLELLVFAPLKPYMTKPRIMKCPDGHFRRTIFSLGPYIADYPEQVWLTGIVSNWCPKCDVLPRNLDGAESHRRSHEKTDILINTYNPRVLWDDFGVRHNIVPFTYFFPHADIHELLAPDLLHHLIKGVFKDHLVDWVMEYLYVTHGEKKSLEIIEDIDRRISAVPPFSGLHRFPDGRDYQQWTGDDSKVLMKVFLAAIAGYVPSIMVRSIATFMDACYIAWRNAIDSSSLEHLRGAVETFHQLHSVFIETGVRTAISMPCQHALKHFYHAIHLFRSPNGLCSSITESKHIEKVKKPWRRSSQYQALTQMLRMLQHMDKMSALHQHFEGSGMLQGFCFDDSVSVEPEDEDESAISGEPLDMSEFDVQLAAKSQPNYPSQLHPLAAYINQPKFPLVFTQFLYKYCHSTEQIVPLTIEECPVFDSAIKPGMEGMEIGCILLFFSFEYRRKNFSCALINWFVHTDSRDSDTGMWTVRQEIDRRGEPTLEVIHLDSIARAAHLLPVYRQSRIPEDFDHHTALDSFNSFFVNHYVDHHAHKFIGGN